MPSANSALLNEFVGEAREHLAAVGEDLLSLEKGDPDPAPRLDRLFRAVHSVKGGAGLTGCLRIGELAHAMEAVLDRLRQSQLPLRPAVTDALLAGRDLIHTLLDDVSHSDEVAVGAALARLHGLVTAPPGTALAAHAPAPFPVTGPVLNERPAGHGFVYALRVELGDYGRRTGREAVRFLAGLQEHGCILDARLGVPDHDLALGMPEGPVEYQCLYSSALAPEQLASRLRLLPGEFSQLAGPTSDQPPGRSAQEMIEEKAPAAGGKEAPAPVPAGGEPPSTVRIGVRVLDRLMTLAGELVLVRNQALRALDPEDAPMRHVVQRLNAITTEVQQAVMLTRMQPVSTLFGKFPRLVRDLSRALGKEMVLTVGGTEVELDKAILEALSDPLTHLVRNCCDHGIETPAERLAAGKPPEGRIELRAHQQAGQICLELSDDGKGIDPRLVRRKALERGLKTAAELAALSDEDAQALILLPGFSTAERVTEVSGRGIGMDVVRTNVEQLRGSLRIESTPGAGTRIDLRLPLTLAIIPCLMVRAGADRYAIPQKDLGELVCLSGEQAAARVEYAYDRQVYRLRDRLLPLVSLAEVLARPAPFTAATRAEVLGKSLLPPGDGRPGLIGLLSFAVVKVGSQRFGLVVDQLLDTEEVVVKPLHPVLEPLRCFSGATIMGDGRVALILDVEGIARHAGVFSDGARPLAPAALTEPVDRPTVLLFRYGPNEQFAVPLALVRRIEEVRASAIERIGEREYVTVKGQPVRVLRLDRYLAVSPGPERETMSLLLPRHLKKSLGILISEIIDTPSLSIDLDTRTHREDGLLGTAVVRGRLTLFLDLYRLGDRIEAEESSAGPSRQLPGPPRQRQRACSRILLVEDTQFFRELVRGYLEGEGYEVVTAANGALGLRELAGQRFDLVVSDIEMPEVDGWRLARAVRDQLGLRDLPLLALTTLNSEQDRERAFQCGFDGYEVKLERASFLARVADLLNRQGAAAAGRGGPADG